MRKNNKVSRCPCRQVLDLYGLAHRVKVSLDNLAWTATHVRKHDARCSPLVDWGWLTCLPPAGSRIPATAVLHAAAIRASPGHREQQLRGYPRDPALQHPPTPIAALLLSRRQCQFQAGSRRSILVTELFRNAATGRSPGCVSSDRSTTWTGRSTKADRGKTWNGCSHRGRTCALAPEARSASLSSPPEAAGRTRAQHFLGTSLRTPSL